MSETNIIIDGSYGEGGGQIIRTSLTLSALTGKPVTIRNVRAKRSRPGLQPQHLMAVQAAAGLCDAALGGDSAAPRGQATGAVAGSQSFTFTPTVPIKAGTYRFDIGTAGASTLVLQTILLPLALADAPSHVTVCGGTHVKHAPTTDYLEHVWGKIMTGHGLDVAFDVPSLGFFPRGGGEARVTIQPSTFTPIDIEGRGRLTSLMAYIVTSGLPDHVADRGAAAAEKALRGHRKPQTVKIDLPSRGQGAAVVVVAECDNIVAGFSAIGERGKPMERVAEEAVDQFVDWYKTGMACDEHLADQLVLPMALACGGRMPQLDSAGETSRWTTSAVTEHLRTVIWVVKHFLDVDGSIEERSDGTGVVRVSCGMAQ